MNELALLKEYVNTLEAENNAKNNERDTLYQQLQQLLDENYNLTSQLNFLQGIRIQHQQQHHIIIQLQQANNFLKCQLDNLIKLLEQRDSLIQHLKYQEQKDSQRIINLEDIHKQNRKNQAKQKNQISELNMHITVLQSQISQLQQQIRSFLEKQSKQSLQMTENTNTNNESKINELIENYQRVEQIAYEKNLENQWLRQELNKLQNQIQKYKYCLNSKNDQVKVLQKKLQSLSHLTSVRNSPINYNQQRRQKQQETGKNSMNLIRQNNRLIERIIELEKEKNLLYFSAVSVCDTLFNSNCSSKGVNSVRRSDGSSNAKSPLKIITSRAVNRQVQGQSKIRQKISELKRDNQILMENLRI